MHLEADKAHLRERIASALADHLGSGKTIKQLAPVGRKRSRQQTQKYRAQASDVLWPELFGEPGLDAKHD